jgi:hypothetical protein
MASNNPNQLVVQELNVATNEYNAKEANVGAQTVTYYNMFEQSGPIYFDELRKFFKERLDSAKKDITNIHKTLLLTGSLNTLFNSILIKRFNLLKTTKDSTKINDTKYIYGLTIRMPKDGSGLNSCRTTGDDDFAIPNEYWSKLVDEYKTENKDTITRDAITMIDAVFCERGLCKDGRWKSTFYPKGMSCPGSSGSETIYPWLQTGSKGGRKTKRRNPRKSKRRPKRRRTRRLKK